MSRLPSGLSDTVEGAETLARFMFSSSLFSSNGVKPAAFLPNPKNGETSVFRHVDETDEQLRAKGAELGGERGKQPHGVAFVKAQVAFDAELQVLPSEPPLKHADIVGWPGFPNEMKRLKGRRKRCAMRLAEAANMQKY